MGAGRRRGRGRGLRRALPRARDRLHEPDRADQRHRGFVPLLVGVASGVTLGPVQWAGVALALAGWRSPRVSRWRRVAADRAGLRAGAARRARVRHVLRRDGPGRRRRRAVGRGAQPLGVAGRPRDGRGRDAPEPGRPARSGLPIVAIGVLDITANALFAAALTHGLAGVVSVLGSLYPVTTVVPRSCCCAEVSGAPTRPGRAPHRGVDPRGASRPTNASGAPSCGGGRSTAPS